MNAKRLAWILPNILLHIAWLGASVFVLFNLRGIQELDLLPYWATFLTLLWFVNIYGSYQIWGWIQDKKI